MLYRRTNWVGTVNDKVAVGIRFNAFDGVNRRPPRVSVISMYGGWDRNNTHPTPNQGVTSFVTTDSEQLQGKLALAAGE